LCFVVFLVARFYLLLVLRKDKKWATFSGIFFGATMFADPRQWIPPRPTLSFCAARQFSHIGHVGATEPINHTIRME
jgi:hypothetical protein